MLDEKTKGAILPTFFIGLGGTGKEILLRLRRKFYEQFGRPDLPCIGYLWLDTDTRAVGVRGEKLDELYDAVSFRDVEQISLLSGAVNADLGDILRNPGKHQYIHDWLYSSEVKQYGSGIKDGAGNVRSVGRLAWFSKYGDIKDRLEDKFGHICSHKSIDDTKKISKLSKTDFIYTMRVFIIGSVVGGTGSGTFIDTSFLIQDLIQTKTFTNIEQIIGIILLPNIYYQSPSDETSKRSYGNAYAALKELEYFTLRRDLSRMGGTNNVSLDFEVKWKDKEEKSIMGPPLSITYLIESKNQAGINLTPSDRSELFRSISETLFLDFLPGEFSQNKRSDYSNVAEHLAKQTNETAPIGGGTEFSQFFAQRYASFGFSKIEIPEDSLHLACSSELAYDILKYWNRINHDPRIKDTVAEDMAKYDLNGNRIPIRFSSVWKTMIKEGIQQIQNKSNVLNVLDVNKLNTEFTQYSNN